MTFKTSKKYYPFAANEDGVVKNIKTGRIRKTFLSNSGYLMVSSSRSSVYVHRIVADAWCPNEDEELNTEVNHIDGDKRNNRSDNLEWCSKSYNMKHAASNGLLNTTNRARGSDCNLSFYNEDQIRKVCDLLQDGMRNVDVSKLTKIPASYIKDIRSGKSWRHVSKDYNFPERKKQSLSEGAVRWICREIVDGTSNVDIARRATNPSINITAIKNIKYKKCYASISDEYF